MILIGLVTLVGLVAADWREARYERSVHLGFGRIADICPCTRRLAEDQYARALWHVRTERQEELVTSQRPRSPRARVDDTVEIVGSGFRWADTATGWAASRVLRSPRF